jgi:hypothetical protein
MLSIFEVFGLLCYLYNCISLFKKRTVFFSLVLNKTIVLKQLLQESRGFLCFSWPV